MWTVWCTVCVAAMSERIYLIKYIMNNEVHLVGYLYIMYPKLSSLKF